MNEDRVIKSLLLVSEKQEVKEDANVFEQGYSKDTDENEALRLNLFIVFHDGLSGDCQNR